jgi:glycosyltransferase involved in cell wall biosynthesis
MLFYSIIIPVYNRPDEIAELLLSLTRQSLKKFEVIIVEDGSTETCKSEVEGFVDKLDIHYFFKENTGQGFSRNYGFDKAKGDYFMVFDSDCILPETYMQTVDEHLTKEPLDAFGGPDRAKESFTIIQKAINYSMTSIFTTGGIRGNKKHAGTYHPRSFNMGISREVYAKTGGYITTRMGEDIEFSIRIIKEGFKVGLIEEAYVYHRRRTTLGQFYKQLHYFGRARIKISRLYANELKLVHFFPVLFLVGWLVLLITWFVNKPLFLLATGVAVLYYALIFIDSTIKTSSLPVGLVSIVAATVQLSAYAIGMVTEIFKDKPKPATRNQ